MNEQTYYTCTAANPWSGSTLGSVQHPDAVEIREYYSDYEDVDSYAEYECPHCKTKFEKVIPR